MKKSKIRLYLNKKISTNLLIYIKNKQHHYLKNVMRCKINDIIRVFDGISGEWTSKVISINKDSTVIRITEITNKIKPDKDIWLIFSPIKQYRMNILIQKATELGVSKIIPCFTEYCNFKSLNISNLQFNAIEAAEQSERLSVPKIEKTVQFQALLNSWPDDRQLIYCDEKLDQHQNIIESLLSVKNAYNKWAVLVGPEGGFSDSEKELITLNKNVTSVSLGKRLLRSDTAITVALYCAQEILG